MSRLSKSAVCLCAILIFSLFPLQAWGAAPATTSGAGPVAPAMAVPVVGAPVPGYGGPSGQYDAGARSNANSNALGQNGQGLTATASGVNTTGQYILGPGDMIAITDYSVENPVARSMPILPDGTVNIYPIGVVKAAGLSLKDFNEMVNRLAAKYIIQPQLEIVVTQLRPAVVYILGEVTNPGLYSTHSIGVDPTGFDVTPTIVSALQRAGGLKDSADIRHVRLTRAGDQRLEVNLWDMLIRGDTAQDIALQAGDTIYVPRGGPQFDPNEFGLTASRTRAVRVWGAVRQPGLYELKPSDDILSVIATAGGFTATGNTGTVLLARMNRDGTVSTHKVSVSKSIRDARAEGRQPIQPGDIIIASESIPKHVAKHAGTILTAMGVGIVLILASYNFKNHSSSSRGNTGSTQTGIAFF